MGCPTAQPRRAAGIYAATFMRLRNSVSSDFGTFTWKGRIALGSCLVTVADLSTAATEIVAAARASDTTAVRVVRLRCRMRGVNSICFFVFMSVFVLVMGPRAYRQERVGKLHTDGHLHFRCFFSVSAVWCRASRTAGTWLIALSSP